MNTFVGWPFTYFRVRRFRRFFIALAADPIDPGPLLVPGFENQVRVDALEELALDQLNGARVSRRHTF